jgi:hypothetical protein
MIGGFSSPEIGRGRADSPFRSLIPDARFRALLGAGHAAHSDVPAQVGHLVRRNAALAH